MVFLANLKLIINMADIDKIKVIAGNNKQMLDAVYKLEEAIKRNNNKEVAEIKGFILSLQRKNSELLK